MSKFLKKYRTTYLFSRTDFFVGWGSIFNVGGNYFMFNYSDSGSNADERATENDWGTIGEDLKATLRKKMKKQLSCAK